MRILDLALKDIRQVLRDKRGVIFLLVMPVVFTFFFGFVFNNQNKTGDTRLKIGIVNRDPDGVLSSALLDLLNASDTIRPELIAETDVTNLDSRIVKDELAAGLIIPAGYSAATLDSAEPQMEMIINEETENGQTARRGLQTSLTRMLGMAQTARLSLVGYEAKNGPLSAADKNAYTADAVRRAAQSWKAASLSVKTTLAADPRKTTDPMAVNPYNQFSPGMIVMFAIFGLTSAALVMVIERRNGAMARLLTTPMTKPELIGGHLLGMFIIFFVQQLLLVVFGQLILKVDYFRQPVATLLIMGSLSLWVAALGLLIAALVKKEDQVILFAMIGMFVFSALGGSWFSLEMVGKSFATIGHLMPTAWAIDGFQNIIVRGLGLESVLLPAGIILAYTVVFFGIAVWKFKYE